MHTPPPSQPRARLAALLVLTIGGGGAAAGTAINALGTGVPGTHISACESTTVTDFMAAPRSEYRRVEPRDCSSVNMRTPVFSWPIPLDRNTANTENTQMTLFLRQPGGNFEPVRTTTTPRVLLADRQLASGEYEWFVSYTNVSGVEVRSAVRRFNIPDRPDMLALPSGEQLAAIVMAKPSPRALPAGVSFPDIVAKAGKTGSEYKPSYDAFMDTAKRRLMPGALEPSITNLQGDAIAANKELVNIETLGYAARFIDDIESRNNYDRWGRERLVALANWNTRGVTSEANNDQANREIYLALGVGLDLFRDTLTPDQRNTVINALLDRVEQATDKYHGFDKNPYDSHLLGATVYVAEALMHAAGTPASEAQSKKLTDMLVRSWEVYVTMLGAWGGTSDGGFANGGSYGWYTLNTLSRMTAAVKLMANIDLTSLPAIGNYGDNQIAQTPAAPALRGQFGDEVEINNHYASYAWNWYRLYASVTGKPEHEWYWRQVAGNVSRGSELPPMHYLLLGLRTPSPPPTAPTLKDSWVFEDAGIVALHSKTADPLRSSLFFRSSRFGSYNHSHADNNAFTFVSKGREMLISGGYYLYYHSPHHALVGRATRFKNALTVDGGFGQSETLATVPVSTGPTKPRESMDTRGKLINFAETEAWAVATGDASLAYRGRLDGTEHFYPFLDTAIRSVAFNRRQGVAVIYDWATSSTPRTWELNFQTLQASSFFGVTGQTVQLLNRNAQGDVIVCMDIHGPAGKLEQTHGFPVAPTTSSGTKADQFQTRWSALTPSRQLVSVTVIREDCSKADVKVVVTSDGTNASVAIPGEATLVFDRKTIRSQ